MGGGLIDKANIPVQELEGQRGEGAYFREDTVYILNVCVTIMKIPKRIHNCTSWLSTVYCLEYKQITGSA